MTKLLSAVEIVLSRTERICHVIPPITDPMGRNWNQPSRFDIEIDEHRALMTRRAFDTLAEYSATFPSGVYPGKMWKRHDGKYDAEFIRKGGKPEWMLVWFGLSSKGPDFCSNNFRKILLVDGEL